jgi:hypothetical protein
MQHHRCRISAERRQIAVFKSAPLPTNMEVGHGKQDNEERS